MTDDILAPQRRIVVLGVGNLLWADEGFGVRCVEALGEAFDVPSDVALMDAFEIDRLGTLRTAISRARALVRGEPALVDAQARAISLLAVMPITSRV